MLVIYLTYIVLPLLTLIGSLGLAYYAWRQRHLRGAAELAHLSLLYAITIFFSLATSLTASEQLVEVWSNLRLLGNVTAAVLSVRFLLVFVRRENWITPWTLILFLTPPVIAHILLWTNDAHHLFKENWTTIRAFGLTFEHAEIKIGYQLHVTAVLLLAVVGILVVSVAFTRRSKLFRWQLVGLLLGFVLQIVIGIYISYAFRAVPFFPNLVYLAFLPAIIIYGWAMFRHARLYTSNITYDDILDNLYETLIVINVTGHIIEINATAARWLDRPPQQLLGELLWPHLARIFPAEVPHFLKTHLLNPQTVEQDVEALHDAVLKLRFVPLLEGENVVGHMLIGRDITTRKRLERAQAENRQALEEARNRYQQLVNHVPGMVYELVKPADDQKPYYNYVSSASQEIGGLRPNEVYQNQQAFVERIAPEDGERFFHKMRVSAKTLTPFHAVARVHFNGKERWHEFHSSPTRLADGATMWHGIEIDVTERYTAQAALQQNEEMLRSIIHSLDDLVFALDPAGTFVAYYQAAGNDKLLASPEAFIGKSYREVLPPAVADQITEAVQEANKPGDVQQFEYQLPIQGQLRWFRAKVSTRYDSQQAIIGYTVVASDIEQQKRYVQQLADNEQQIRAIVDHSPIPMVVTDTEETLLLVNDQFTKLFGYTLEDIPHVDEWFRHAYPNEEQRQKARRQWRQRVARMMAGEKFHSDRSTELVVRCKDGSERVVLITGERAADQFIIILQDMTEQRRVEKALKMAKEAAEEANQAKSRFLANMSHELRTPLNAILGFTELLTQSDLSAADMERVQIIYRSGRHLLDLINDVLELSKIEAGQSILNQTQFSLPLLLHETYELFVMRAQKKNLTYTAEIAPDLPRTVIGDQLKLRQILLNLLSNAIKFTAAGTVTLSAAWLAESRELQLTVSDTGVGIEPEEQHHLFEPFTQTQSGRNSQQGTGLGLTLVREHLSLMGGEVSFTSVPAEGTTFHITIPLEVAAVGGDVVPQLASSQLIRQAILEDHTIPRILLVDDIMTNLLVVETVLTRVGINVQTAVDGQEALERVVEFDPHLILMDLRMPVLDGYETTAALREQGFQRPIIALTASVFAHSTTLAEKGFDGYLAKPLDSTTLFETLLRHLPIRYEYTSTASGQQLPAVLSPDLQPLIDDLHQAVVELNSHKALQLITQLKPYDADLAAQLGRLVQSYQLDKIAAWITTLPTGVSQ